MLMLDDDNIAVATRSACATGSLRASHVLLSIGRSHADAQGTLVITFGIDNTESDIDYFLASLQKGGQEPCATSLPFPTRRENLAPEVRRPDRV
jgi:cysteine sulfinate desulfinase/cysteine desulfurase-like protein